MIQLLADKDPCFCLLLQTHWRCRLDSTYMRSLQKDICLVVQGKAKPPPLRTITVHRVSASEAASSAVQKVTTWWAMHTC